MHENRNWSEAEDKKLNHLVLDIGILDWKELGRILNASVDDVKLRWKKVIYPSSVQTSKEGASKWSKVEDSLLERGYKNEIDIRGELKPFFPIRSSGSMRARWNRIKDSCS